LRNLKAKGCGQKVELILTDVRKESLALAAKRAEQAGVADQVSCERISFLKLADHFAEQSFDIVEACGILDYLPDDRAVALIQFALSALKDDGQIIISNMSRTRAANLLLKMYNWPIIYRTPEEFGRLIEKAGGRNIKVYVEPWGIHPVATADKK
jgi:2-polyprenyl-3-methyl-5-hydroxy-6-metoxy-1,4-benzoquinol methylase